MRDSCCACRVDWPAGGVDSRCAAGALGHPPRGWRFQGPAGAAGAVAGLQQRVRRAVDHGRRHLLHRHRRAAGLRHGGRRFLHLAQHGGPTNVSDYTRRILLH
ncbi:Protein of unknown function, partial [Gryllus bimaculatus]